ncbi:MULTISPECIES: hypothetical protein [unclassified Methylobacterium]|uniref:hypothetical protein n=1 Tax=unclassified Methylobacterium TaxID=2615210 RepID=UPI002269E619|nr:MULTISPECIES: hypothetical protein [unclassified Methylobacterium]
MVSDASADLATFLLKEVASRTPSIFAFMVAESRRLPEDPDEAHHEVRQRWPELTDEERGMAFSMALSVLRRIEQDCAENIARLDTLAGNVGHG